MSEIPFVSQLGETLEQTLAPKIKPARRRLLLPRWLSPRIAVVLGVLVVGGGAATAATLIDQGTTTLVAHGLSCISGTNNGNAKTDAYNVTQNGASPTDACATLIGVPAARLVACADTKAGVVVYESDGDPNQCQSLGLTPLPVDYTTAIGRVHALERALTADYNKADCMSPRQLAQDADSDLQRLAFVGWHAVIDTASAAGAEYAGPCGEFPATGAFSTADAALDASNHTVMIELGATRSALQLGERNAGRMATVSGQRCYTLATAQQLVHNMLNAAAGHTVPVRFAVAQEPPNDQMSDTRQQYYDQGCTIIAGFGTASDGQTFLVLLENKAGKPQPAEGSTSSQRLAPEPQGLPDRDFQPRLTQG